MPEQTDVKARGTKENLEGRHAESPSQFGPRAWKQIVLRTYRELSRDNIAIVAAGLAFYSLMSIIPALTAFIGIYGLFSDPNNAEKIIAKMAGGLSPEMQSLAIEQLQKITVKTGAAGWSAALGILFAFWSGSRAVQSLIGALNIAYHEEETRGFFRLNLTALALTLGGIIMGIIAITMMIVVPAIFTNYHFPPAITWTVSFIQWPILGLLATAALAFLYSYGPDRKPPKWRWVTPGATFATVLWLAGSILFAQYVAHFGKFGETYGSMGAVVILLMWFNLSAYLVLIGAEINSEAERQTEKDSTRGAPKPIGRRGADAADVKAA